MKNANLLFLLLYLQQVTTDLRNDNCCYWMVSKGYDLPEFSERRVLNEVTVYYHDSSLKSKMPCPDWINTTAGIREWGQIQYWSNHNRFVGTLGLQSAINQFNLTGTLTDRNIYQGFGCCSLYPNGTYSAFLNHAFNGKDFTSFDINSKTFVAAVPQAVVYKTLRESDQSTINDVASYYQKTCLDRLKILMEAPRVRAKRIPDVRILEPKKKVGSVTVTCHVTGFYPREVQVFWLGSDLQPVDEGVTEILPNDDGTYQTRKSVIVPEEDVGKQNYSCVVLHISIPNNITKVWEVKAGGVAVWIPLLCISLLASVIGIGVWWRCKTRDAVI
ncbi:class I histocompatibility antigen, F10 alpha chain-like [Astyanax mexicanus]|uniref:class I histocompatibility antigen, F10 alpha chain-like n=1 Tax=Astyanax mexicanus TaxID=7994 RepID=UPI0020CAFAE8|nr:class I histocompatibility antigen, F10 alpha chain-like [Astyanax mexicanus]